MKDIESILKPQQLRRQLIIHGLIIATLFIGGLVFAINIEVPRGVPLFGELVYSQKKSVIQHELGGVIVEIFVGERDIIRQGQQVLALDSTAYLEEKEILLANSNALIKQIERSEESEIGLERAIRNRESQLLLMEDEFERTRQAIELGLEPARALESLKSRRLQLENEMEQLNTRISELSKTIEELRFGLEGGLKKLERVNRFLEGSIVRSPADGQVLGINELAPGKFLSGGEIIAEVIPEDTDFSIMSWVTPNFRDQLEIGDTVILRLPTLQGAENIQLRGFIHSMSNSVMVQQDASPRYPMEVRFEDGEVKRILSFNLVPGIQAQLIVQAGSRTLLDYLLAPLRDRLFTAFKEY